MAGDAAIKTLDELYEFGSGLSKPRAAFGTGYPFLSFKDIFYNSAVPSDLKELVQSTDEEQRRCSIQRGDVFLTRTSETMDELGMSSVALRDVQRGTFNGFTKRLRPRRPSEVVPEYARYFFRSPAFRASVTAMSSMSTRASLNNEMLSRLSITLPPRAEQGAIGTILGTLDDKIELNRRTSATLEAMARALFQSWFGDFDPVRAKIEGRWQRGQSLPGLPAQLYDLFPDRLVDSELGEIPEGWGVGTIGDLAEIVGGSTPSTKEPRYWDGGTHCWATPKDLSNLSTPVLLDTERRVTDEGLAAISSGLLQPGIVLMSSRAPIGYLAIANVPVAINQGFIAMKPRVGTSSLYLWLWTAASQDEIVSRANGSTFLEISKANFRPIPLARPAADVMATFDRMARPTYEKIVVCERESRTLATLRDTLLPELISGELRVKDAERFVAAVT